MEELLDKLVENSASPGEMIGILTRKMRISRLTMPPEQIQYVWQLCETDPAKVEVK